MKIYCLFFLTALAFLLISCGDAKKNAGDDIEAVVKVKSDRKDEVTEKEDKILILDDEAIVKYIFTHDKALDSDYINLMIGGEQADPNGNKVDGVEIFTAGHIIVKVKATRGFGNWKLQITEVIRSNGTIKKTKPDASDNIHVTGNKNREIDLTFTID